MEARAAVLAHAAARVDPDAAAVRLDDGAADREPEPDARRRGLALAARELLEERFLPARRQAGAVVRDRRDDLVAAQRAPRPSPCCLAACTSRRSPAGCTKTRSIEHRIEVQQRQVVRDGGRRRRCRARSDADRLQRAADHFLQRLPLQVQLHRAALQSRHVEQVADHRVHAPGPGGDALRRGRSLPASGRGSAARAARTIRRSPRAACAGRATPRPAANCAAARTPSAPSRSARPRRSARARARRPAAPRTSRAAGAARARAAGAHPRASRPARRARASASSAAGRARRCRPACRCPGRRPRCGSMAHCAVPRSMPVVVGARRIGTSRRSCMSSAKIRALARNSTRDRLLGRPR